MNENLIDRYLLNILSPEEKKAFELRLENEKALVEELNQQRKIINEIEGFGRIELKSKLKEIHNEVSINSSKPNTKIRKIIYSIAAAAIFIGVLSTCWLWTSQAPTNSELYALNFEPYELSLNQRSEGDITLKNIESLYVDGSYYEVIPLFKNALDESTLKSSQILLGLGISYLQTKQSTQAIEQFNAILANKDFNYEDEAQWYLGLSYLKLDEINKAKDHLNILASDSSKDHHEAAKVLISQIKKK